MGIPHAIASIEKMMKLFNPQGAGGKGQPGKQAAGPQGAGMPMGGQPSPPAGAAPGAQLDPQTLQMVMALMQARQGAMG